MPFTLVQNDITKMQVDAIVNAAKPSLLGGGGVDGAIHKAAGPELLEECRKIGGISVGEAVITGGYKLPARYVIHTAGPIFKGGLFGEKKQLESCYLESLKLAEEYGLKSVAFPLISAGVYHYPKKQALQVAEQTIVRYLKEHDSDMDVSLVIYDRDSFQISSSLVREVRSFIDDRYVEAAADFTATPGPRKAYSRKDAAPQRPAAGATLQQLNALPQACQKPLSEDAEEEMTVFSAPEPAAASLDDMLRHMDESFTQMLLRKIDESGMTDVECYKKANIDRKLFSKIRMNPGYRPKKTTAVAFAIALELSIEETRELLQKAGYALSRSSKFDIIIEYFITNRKYDIFTINECLFEFDQVLLGA